MDVKIHDPVVSIQARVRGFLARKKYAISQLPDEKLTSYPTLAIGNDPEIDSLEKYQRPGKIAVLSTAGLRAIDIAGQLKKPNGTKNDPEIDKDEIPLIVIMDISKSVRQFWKNLRTFMQDDSQTGTLQLCLENLNSFLLFNDSFYVAKGLKPYMGFQQADKDERKQVFNHFKDLFSTYGYEFIRTMVSNAVVISQSWAYKDNFIKFKNIFAYRGIKHIYAHPSNLIGCISSPEDKKEVIKNIRLLNPVVSIHSNFCKKHECPEKILFFQRENEEKIFNDLSFSLCYRGINAELVVEFIRNYHPNPLQFYRYLTEFKQKPEWRYDINEADYYGKTALLAAAETGNTDLALAIIQMGAYINARDKNFHSALIGAIQTKNLPLIKILVKNGYILGHPFDRPFIENSTVEIRNYLAECLIQQNHKQKPLSEGAVNSLGRGDTAANLQNAILNINKATDFPQNCENELKLLEKTLEKMILSPRNSHAVEIAQWLLGTNLICLHRLKQGTHQSNLVFHPSENLSYASLMQRTIPMYKILIAYGDSLKCINTRALYDTDSYQKPKPLAHILGSHSDKGKFFIQVQNDRYKKLEAAIQPLLEQETEALMVEELDAKKLDIEESAVKRPSTEEPDAKGLNTEEPDAKEPNIEELDKGINEDPAHAVDSCRIL